MGFFDDIEEDIFTDPVDNTLKQVDKLTANRQKIVIKMIQMSTLCEKDVEIPDYWRGWRVVQIATTPLENAGKTTHMAITMLLEEI